MCTHIRAKSSLGGVKVWSFLKIGLEHHFRAPDSSCKWSISRWWLLKDRVQCPFVVIQSYPVLFVCKALPFRRRRRLLAPMLKDMWQYDAETYSIINVASRASYSAALFSSSKSVFADNVKVANIGAWLGSVPISNPWSWGCSTSGHLVETRLMWKRRRKKQQQQLFEMGR